MRRVPFTKLSGAGNDFILIDRARIPRLGSAPALAKKLCPRAVSIGADGLLLLRRGRGKSPIELDYYNADGSRAFCGNGARCAAVWARRAGWAGKNFAFQTPQGLVDCRITAPHRAAAVRLPEPGEVRTKMRLTALGRTYSVGAVDIGVPHAVVRVGTSALAAFPVERVGRALRRHPAFRPKGANVNFIAIGHRRTHLRTYERGVEGETLACGTGAAAAALLTSAWTGRRSPVRLRTLSGEDLTVRFSKTTDGRLPKASGSGTSSRYRSVDFSDVWLEGPAHFVYEGETRL